jgi:CBS domain-containing protein
MMTIRDLVSAGPWEGAAPETRRWLAQLLRGEGVDLSSVTSADLRRGTAVYVEADAPALDVQRRMALHHIRVLPVLSGGELMGVIDLVELAGRDDLTV